MSDDKFRPAASDQPERPKVGGEPALDPAEQSMRDAFSETGTRYRPAPSWEANVWRTVLRNEAPAVPAPRLQRFAVAAVGVMCVVVALMGWKLWTLGDELDHHRAAAREVMRLRAEAERAKKEVEQVKLAMAQAEAEQSRLESELREARDPGKMEALRRQIVAKQESIRKLKEKNRAARARDRKARKSTRRIACDPDDPLCGL